MNAHLNSVEWATLSHPAEVILLFDSSQGVKNAADEGQSLRSHGLRSGGMPPRPSYRFFGMQGIIIRESPPVPSPELAATGFSYGPTVAFADGHCRRLRSEEVPSPRTGMWKVETRSKR